MAAESGFRRLRSHGGHMSRAERLESGPDLTSLHPRAAAPSRPIPFKTNSMCCADDPESKANHGVTSSRSPGHHKLHAYERQQCSRHEFEPTEQWSTPMSSDCVQVEPVSHISSRIQRNHLITCLDSKKIPNLGSKVWYFTSPICEISPPTFLIYTNTV